MRQIKAVFNGSFDSIENIKVSPFSRAYTFSDSVYEVLPFYNKKLIAFKSHIERLQRSVFDLLDKLAPRHNKRILQIPRLVHSPQQNTR